MTYYLQDHPNPDTPQYGWERARLGQPGVHLSGVIGVHTSEAPTDFEGPDFNAENNAAFIARRGEYGSYHTTGDADSIVPLVHPRYAAWADTTNNAHALSVSGCLQAARWLEMTPERRRAVVVNMAVAAARMVQAAVADGYLAAPTPAVRISAAEAISGSRPGFYGHGETNPGTRYDPGVHFDWGMFLTTYANAIGGGIQFQSTVTETGFLMALTDKQQEDIYWFLCAPDGREYLAELVGGRAADKTLNTPIKRYGSDLGGESSLAAFVAWNDTHVQAIVNAVSAVAPTADLEAIKAAVREGLAEGVKVNATVTVEGGK